MDTDKTGHQDAGSGQKGIENDNPNAKDLDTAPLLSPRVQGFGFGVGPGVASEGETKKKEDANEIEGELLDEEPETTETRPKLTAKDSETEIKHAAMVILEENGLSHGAIAKAIGRAPQTVHNTVNRLKKESLASPRMARLARKTVEAVLTGFLGTKERQADGTVAVVTDRRVKASDGLKAAEMVQSRYDPAEQAVAPGSQTFLQINIGQYNRD